MIFTNYVGAAKFLAKEKSKIAIYGRTARRISLKLEL